MMNPVVNINSLLCKIFSAVRAHASSPSNLVDMIQDIIVEVNLYQMLLQGVYVGRKADILWTQFTDILELAGIPPHCVLQQ